MNDFPNVPLTIYTEAPEGRASGLKRFKIDLKDWIKVNNLSYVWLAQNLGKSIGTVKNWVYADINIDNTKLTKILELCQSHTKGGRGVIYREAQNSDAIDYIWIRPYMLVEAKNPPEKVSEGASGEVELTPLKINHGWYKLLYEKWCSAAGVPEDTLFNKKALHYPKLARWVTKVIMAATQQTLVKAKEEKKFKETEISELGALTDMGAVLQGTPCSCSFFAGKKFDSEGILVADSKLKRKDICFFLPVIRDEWRGDFVRLAAGFSNLPNTDLWMSEQLNKKALKLIGSDLSDFISYRYTVKEN